MNRICRIRGRRIVETIETIFRANTFGKHRVMNVHLFAAYRHAKIKIIIENSHTQSFNGLKGVRLIRRI